MQVVDDSDGIPSHTKQVVDNSYGIPSHTKQADQSYSIAESSLSSRRMLAKRYHPKATHGAANGQLTNDNYTTCCLYPRSYRKKEVMLAGISPYAYIVSV